ncbi:MAG: hypothetical protein NC114_12140, partial [Ruminococcus flavefaciens]|nr:hypothetical protein [Ruminococcus flavefaciens]
ITSIEIREKRLYLTTGQSYTPTVYGYNQYGILVDTDVKNFTCIVSPLLGEVINNTFTAGNNDMRGNFIVDYNGLQYSIPVYINGGTGEEVSSSIHPAIIENECNKPLYYDMMGRKVDNPAPGNIVIKYSNSNSSLILINNL